MTDIIIDLGEDGEIIIEASDEGQHLSTSDGATEKAGFGDTARGVARGAGNQIRVGAAKLLQLPLTGVAKLLLASIPEPALEDRHELDTFSVEFNLGVKTEAGVDVGAVAKIMPEGAFKCTYTWKRKAEPNGSA